MASLLSLFLSNPRSFRPSHPNPSHQIHLSQRHQIVNFSANTSGDPKLTINQPPPPPPPPSRPTPEKKKSFAVVSGEIFVSLASRIIQTRIGGERKDPNFAPIGTSERNSEREPVFWRRRKEGIASLVEGLAEPEVVWEQKPKHVEAERGRAVMTSPGFSFSAAGLLFPYHLGVAEFLIEKSYIKVTLLGILVYRAICLILRFDRCELARARV